MNIISNKPKSIPLFSSSVAAGFPSPADDFLEKNLDLHEYLIKNPAATFLVRVKGSSMIQAGIFSGDMLVVDRSLKPTHKSIVVAVVDGEFTVKRMQMSAGQTYLVPENRDYKPIRITEDMDVQIWGVVTTVIHQLHSSVI